MRREKRREERRKRVGVKIKRKREKESSKIRNKRLESNTLSLRRVFRASGELRQLLCHSWKVEREREFARGLLNALAASEWALPVATNGVAVWVEVGIAGFGAASFAFKVQTRAAATQCATVLAKTCCTGTVAAALVVVAESCRRFVEERGRRSCAGGGWARTVVHCTTTHRAEFAWGQQPPKPSAPSQPPPLTPGPPPLAHTSFKICRKPPELGLATLSQAATRWHCNIFEACFGYSCRHCLLLLLLLLPLIRATTLPAAHFGGCLVRLRGWPAIDMRNIARGNAHFRFAVGWIPWPAPDPDPPPGNSTSDCFREPKPGKPASPRADLAASAALKPLDKQARLVYLSNVLCVRPTHCPRRRRLPLTAIDVVAASQLCPIVFCFTLFRLPFAFVYWRSRRGRGREVVHPQHFLILNQLKLSKLQLSRGWRANPDLLPRVDIYLFSLKMPKF